MYESELKIGKGGKEESKELKMFGINVPPLPLSEIPRIKPDLSRFLKPIDYPWIEVETKLRQRISLMSKEAGNVDLSVTEPPQNVSADLAVACHRLAKSLGKNPAQIAQEFSNNYNLSQKVEYVGKAEPTPNGYINFELNTHKFGNKVLQMVERDGSSYGNENIGDGKKVIIDCSSPNVAKYMSVGHLRSTVIGESLARIYKAGGYEVIRDNHLGDWGTQFGILGKAKELWGDEIDKEMPNAEPVQKLYHLYVKMHEEIDKEKTSNPNGESNLENEGRAWFKRLEEGDPQALELLKETTAQSIQEFKRVYKVLGSNYEYFLGESFYVSMLPDVVDSLLKNKIAQTDEKGAVTVEFPKDKKINNLMIRKSDGASLYATRELATLTARTAWFNPDKILYVVGGDQKNYFNQVFTTFDQLTKEKKPHLEHVSFGMVSLPEGKMSTRKGRVIFLEDVLNEAISRARATAEKTNRNLTKDEIDQIARQTGVGAVIYLDLGQSRDRNIKFDWDQALSLEGNSAPYIQYSHARGESILRKAKEEGIEINLEQEAEFTLPTEVKLIKNLGKFPKVLTKAIEANEPSVVAEYVFKTADLYNQFYQEASILKESDASKRNSRLRLTAAATQVIKNGLNLLGIEAPDKM